MAITSELSHLAEIATGYGRRFPAGNDPFQMLGRLLEEAGELAQQVNHLEDTGVKRAKHGPPSMRALAREVEDVILAALQVAVYYDVVAAVADGLTARRQRLLDEGYLEERGDVTPRVHHL
jgi:NTP pyrophosphatase (non-canonical NTP hydrolase)